MTPVRTIIALAVVSTTLALAPGPASVAATPDADSQNRNAGSWTMGGHDLANTRSNPFEHRISTSTVAGLGLAWTSATTGDVSATPAVSGGAVYFPDWGGTFWKVEARTGRVLWSHKVADYVGIDGAVSRTSPAVTGQTVFIGTQQGAQLLAVDTATGNLRWKTRLDPHPAAILTQAPVVSGGVVYEGVSSQEEISAFDPAYPCCTFRGSLVAVEAASGKILWQSYTIEQQTPGPAGPADVFSGAAVWGGTPTVDPASGTVYVTTGNNYEIPASAEECQKNGGTPKECLPAWNHVNSFIAFDSRTGKIKWATGQDRFDVWNGACIPGVPPNNCQAVPGPDFDFADGTHLFDLPGANGHHRRAVGAGQKSGEYWMLDAVTGAVIWSAVTGPGSFIGGIQYGSATDGRRIYFTQTNGNNATYTLPDGTSIDYSSFGALDAATGKSLWQIPEPGGATSAGTVSTANGVVYIASMTGVMYALDGATGRQLWKYQGEAPSIAGPAVVDGSVYWGNGYSRISPPGTPVTPGTKFYAFRLPRPGGSGAS